jgi:outer membrane biosynthesis protein TonB
MMINSKDTETKSDKLIAFFATLAIHAALLLLLFLLIIKTPIPPYPGGETPGIEINFGDSPQGMGDILTEDPSGSSAKQLNKDSNKEPVKKTENSPAPPDVTSNVEETVNIKTTPVKTKEQPVIKEQTVKKEPVVEKAPQPSKELENALSVLGKKKNNKTGSDGITGLPGNQGDPNGTNDTRNYNGTPGTGGGPGSGPSINLKGRSLLIPPEIINDSRETGIVVVEIHVDSEGNIINIIPGYRGSTTTSSVLYSKASQALRKAKFNKSPDGTPVQVGTITFDFRNK